MQLTNQREVNLIKTIASIIGKLLLLMVIMFVFIILALIGYFLVTGFSTSKFENIASSGTLIYAQMIGFIVAIFLMYAFFERKKGWALGIKQRGAVVFTIQGLLTGAILISLSSVLIWALGGIEWEWIGFNREVNISLLKGFLLFTGVALSEEILSRGYVQGLLKHHYGSTAAIITSSILFALLHGSNPGILDSPFPLLNIFLAGLLLALARELTGGLWMPIGLHLTWNYFQGYVYGFSVSGTDTVPSLLQTINNGPNALSGGSFGVEGSFTSTLVLLIGIIAVYYYYMDKAPSISRL